VVPTDGAALRRALDLPTAGDPARGDGVPLAVAVDPTGTRS
jgi:hypothetical protein